MLFDDGFRFKGKEYRLIGGRPQTQGIGKMYVFREVKKKISSEIEELSEECKIFQVYGSNGSVNIDSYNNSKNLIPYLRRFIKKRENSRSQDF